MITSEIYDDFLGLSDNSSWDDWLNTFELPANATQEHKKTSDLVASVTKKIYSEFPSEISPDSPLADTAILNRKRMWQSLRAHEHDYWAKNLNILRAVINAFESTGPTIMREQKTDPLQAISSARSELQRLLDTSLDSTEKVKRADNHLSYFERIVQIYLGIKVEPRAVTVPDPVFGDATEVMLFGSPESLVWKHKTVYCVATTIVATQDERKTRQWVDWKLCNDITARAKVCIFLRPKDWRRDESKLCLVGQSKNNRDGWRTFRVKSLSIKEQEPVIKSEPSPPPSSQKASIQEPSLLKRVEILEAKMDAIMRQVLPNQDKQQV